LRVSKIILLGFLGFICLCVSCHRRDSDESYCVFGETESCHDFYTGEPGYSECLLDGTWGDCIIGDCECTQNTFQCDGDAILGCDDGCNWSAFQCADICVDDGGFSGDCSYSEGKEHDVCWCNGESECKCSLGDFQCSGSNLLICDNGCDWTTYGCESLCNESGYDYFDVCDYSAQEEHDICQCTDSKPSCECSSGDYSCSGDTINVCDDGCHWTNYDCEDLCSEDGYWGECSYDEDVEHDVCWCNE
jgi:hypothetical protein